MPGEHRTAVTPHQGPTATHRASHPLLLLVLPVAGARRWLQGAGQLAYPYHCCCVDRWMLLLLQMILMLLLLLLSSCC